MNVNVITCRYNTINFNHSLFVPKKQSWQNLKCFWGVHHSFISKFETDMFTSHMDYVKQASDININICLSTSTSIILYNLVHLWKRKHWILKNFLLICQMCCQYKLVLGKIKGLI